MAISVHVAAAAVFALVGVAAAQQTAWGECGGVSWTGPTTCVAGYTCVYSNEWYSQCIPGTSTTTSTTTTSVSTGTGTSPTGYVKTSGQKFSLNGADFVPVGSNAYWLAQMSNADIDKAFSDAAAGGYNVMRTWGFNDVTSASGTYYQLWSNGVGTLNTGSNGLGKFDYVVSSAKAHGIRLIVTLTNNWSDYGGMDVYVSQLNSGGTHDTFYTNSKIIAAYEKYINGFVSRYKTEPTILGWELANEPRCGGSSGSPSSSCNSQTLTAWARTISAYIKSIDSNHLVAIGDEGWIYSTNPPSYPYQGNVIGIDFAANLAISTLDFGTYHLYPEGWGQSANITGFGNQWITDHATIQKSVGKPTILEEFGVTSSKDSVYSSWFSTLVSTGTTGELYWQLGTVFPDGSVSSNDGYAVYPTDAAYPVITNGVKSLKSRG